MWFFAFACLLYFPGGGVGGGGGEGVGRREQDSRLPGVDFAVCSDFYLLLGRRDDF